MKKAELRAIYKAKRTSISNMDELSSKVAENFFTHIKIDDYSVIHSFLASESKNELNTWLIINKIKVLNPQINIVVPVSDLVNGSMISCALNEKSDLKENKWGIPEPCNLDEVAPNEIDLVLLPLLIFDKMGNRVGYGKGFYDRFLEGCRPDVLKVGLSLFEPEEKIEDVSEWDIPLDAAITPDNVYFF